MIPEKRQKHSTTNFITRSFRTRLLVSIGMIVFLTVLIMAAIAIITSPLNSQSHTISNRAIVTIIAGAAFFILFLAIIALVIIVNAVARPIKVLADTSSQFIKGNFENRIAMNRQDELGVLADAFNIITDQLRSLVKNLEQMVTNRTTELQKRTIQIRVAGEIARDIASLENLDDLLKMAVNLIRDRFGYYHTGIFLLDDQREYTVLRAATGEAGSSMLERGHKLRTGETGIVGYVAGEGLPRIALNVGEDAQFFRNPLLPETRSEMALPLKAGGKVIGVLDVQSRQPGAFTQEDIDVLQTMADQLAIAIEKAHLLEQLQHSVHELEFTYRQRTVQAWREYLTESKKMHGFRYRQFSLEPYADLNIPARTALAKKKSVVVSTSQEKGNGSGGHSLLAIPIEIRGQSIGVINLEFASDYIDPSLVTLIENVANRLALALENARLLEEIQHNAEREHLVSDISSKVRATTDIPSILRVAVQELSQALGVSNAVIKLHTEKDNQEAE
jgi:GAF domain-containing protein/HAMP domain-containing protein